jgi:hypothetical protein
MLALVSLAVAVSSGSIAADRPKLSSDPKYFPIGVWLQSPANARRYRDIGINLYVGLWQGPTEEQIQTLEAAQMPVICDLNAWAERNLQRRIIVGWMHGDEPDNAQALPDGKGYGPPILPAKVVADFERIRRKDPSRPVLLNLGQGVAWEGWYGRGVRTGHLEDYPQYVKGADIASFDIYPVTAKNDAVRGKLEMVGLGTKRLRDWAGTDQRVWACVEATHIDNAEVKPTPEQTRAMAWMAIVHGATGLIYFSHQFAPTFVEAGILADEKMAKGVKATNEEIARLAPILNAAPAKATAEGGVAVLAKRYQGQTHLFVISTSATPVKGTIKVAGLKGKRKFEVVGSKVAITAKDGAISDSFGPYEMRHYRMR